MAGYKADISYAPKNDIAEWIIMHELHDKGMVDDEGRISHSYFFEAENDHEAEKTLDNILRFLPYESGEVSLEKLSDGRFIGVYNLIGQAEVVKKFPLRRCSPEESAKAIPINISLS